MTKRISIACIILFSTFLWFCSDNPRDNPFDTGGTGFHAPTATAMADTSVAIYDTVVLYAAGSDENGTIARYEWRGIEDAALSGNTTDSIYRVVFDTAGTQRVRLRTKDNDGLYSDWDTITITVHLYPPMVIAMADFDAAIRDSITLHASGSDTNGTVDTYIWRTRNNSWKDTVSDSVCTAYFTTAKVCTLLVKVLDDDAIVSAEDTVILTLHLYSPTVIAMDDSSVGVSDSFYVHATASDTNGTIIKYAWALDGVHYNDTTAVNRKKTAFASTGIKTIRVRAIDDDSIASASDSVRITVKDNTPINVFPANNATVTTLKPSIQWVAGFYNDHFKVLLDTVNPPLTAVDASTTDTFYIPATNLTISDTYYWKIVGYNALGDSAAGSVWHFTTPANQSPEFSSDSASIRASVIAGNTYTDTVHAADPEGDPLTFSLLTAITGLIFSDSIITWTPGSADTGAYHIAIAVADNHSNTDTLAWTIRVLGLVGNHAPIFTTDSASMTLAAMVGIQYKDTLLATDTDGDDRVYSFIDSAVGMTLTNTGNMGRISWIPAAGDTGAHHMHARVSDGQGAYDTVSWTITVLSPVRIGMKLIPAGNFKMGSATGSADQQPSHWVTVSSFYMDTTEVTQANYQAIMGINPSTMTGNLSRPVDSVNWFDAVVFCNFRSKNQGFDTVYTYTDVSGAPGAGCILSNPAADLSKNGFRLPTEAEFEYALRAGTTTDHYWGNDHSDSAVGENVWFFVNSGNTTHPVATKPANPFGLRDIAGNVWEWCHDWFATYTTSSQFDPSGPGTGTYRTRRGGSYQQYYSSLLSFFRSNDYPRISSNDCGLRCVRRGVMGTMNHPPYFTHDSTEMTLDAVVGALYQDTVHAADGDADALTYRVIGSPGGSFIITDSVITWTPTGVQAGPQYVEIEVSDGSSGADTLEWSISVSSDLLAYYPFGGTDADDSSGNGHGGVMYGSVGSTLDRFMNSNGAYRFDGATGYIDIGSFPPINAYSVSLWFKKQMASGYSPVGEADLFGTQTSTNKYFKFGFHPTWPDQIRYRLNDGASGYVDKTSVRAITDTLWHHIVVTRTNDTVQMFIDNQPESLTVFAVSGSMTGAITTGAVTKIGTVGGVVDAMFDGCIDDVVIYGSAIDAAKVDSLYHVGGWIDNQAPIFISTSASMCPAATGSVQYYDTLHASDPDGDPLTFRMLSMNGGTLDLTDSVLLWTPLANLQQGVHHFSVEVADNMGATDTLNWDITVTNWHDFNGLLAYYTFSANADDASGNTLSGSQSNVTNAADRFGTANSAFQFNGTSSYIDLGIMCTAVPTFNDFSISLWFKIDTLPAGGGTLYGALGNSDQQIKINIGSDGKPYYWFCRTTDVIQRGYLDQAVSLHSWHHLVVRRSASTVTMYLDNTGGAVIATVNTGALNGIATGNEHFIGAVAHTGNPEQAFKGYIDDIAIYTTVITPTQVDSIYYSGGWPITPTDGMKLITGGTFQMGSADSTNEQPIHVVTLSSFWMDSTEVTQESYQAIFGLNPSLFPGDINRPVENVTWFDAVLYCNVRSKQAGLDTVYSYTSVTGIPGDSCTDLENLAINFTKNGYRLPTEAEWEYACRAGTTTQYYWGAAVDGAYAWYGANSNTTPHPVASTTRNARGLYDMAGNVWEWCNDWYLSTYYSGSPGSDPMGPGSGTTRVERGGSWLGTSDYLRSAFRNDRNPGLRFNYLGFRTVCNSGD
ncbi:MAG: hypothetical protein A2268_13410 [Candidatus Raymondbacteria bacterium RifOxyA12_full_50_37]|nr:MAG: hypothetical protein A2268_13410 [Candidatus Raymondbacteria bacterium RifOxyA12_full_50_37]OGJ91816.1 MAG: hypothetical protein A2248_00300 [Candidatus Raymondbacteria bacterium RIFOXYA2_FULL_49_16]OGP43957.1 MAG: hypothetical protein A2324_11910 [Candidatus Raymondbacteria bacterium RIFOXYB2_FULL_49_35]